MTVEEEEERKEVIAETSSEVNSLSSGSKNVLQHDSLRNKVEEMQKRIHELKEKVKYEGERLCNKELVSGEDAINSKSTDSLSDNATKDSLSHYLQTIDIISEAHENNEERSDKSLYFSASNYSMCSVSSCSMDSACSGFAKFVNNFMKNQDYKERLNLLKMHSDKQISMNMMKTSLSEVDFKCSEELEFIESSLQRLMKLAEEFKVNIDRFKEVDNGKKPIALGLSGSGDYESWRTTQKSSSEWIQAKHASISDLDSPENCTHVGLKRCKLKDEKNE